MGVLKVKSEFSRINLLFSLDTSRTPAAVIQYFLEFSDEIDAFAKVLKTERRMPPAGLLSWGKRLFYGGLTEVVLSLEQGAERPDLILRAMPKPGILDWPARYKTLIYFVEKSRIPLLLIPDDYHYRPFKNILTGVRGLRLPLSISCLGAYEEVEYTPFRERGNRLSLPSYYALRFDEMGYLPRTHSNKSGLRDYLKSKDVDLVLVSPEMRAVHWKTLLRGKTPVLVLPPKSSGMAMSRIPIIKLGEKALKKFKSL